LYIKGLSEKGERNWRFYTQHTGKKARGAGWGCNGWGSKTSTTSEKKNLFRRRGAKKEGRVVRKTCLGRGKKKLTLE